MTGRITRLIDDAQVGTIAGEDGVDYGFTVDALLGVTFGSLNLGTPVTFIPNAGSKRAGVVRIAAPKTEGLR
jgi:hypothetical protein